MDKIRINRLVSSVDDEIALLLL